MNWRFNCLQTVTNVCMNRFMNILRMKSEKGSFSQERGFPLLVHWQKICRLPEVPWILLMDSWWRKDMWKQSPKEVFLSAGWMNCCMCRSCLGVILKDRTWAQMEEVEWEPSKKQKRVFYMIFHHMQSV